MFWEKYLEVLCKHLFKFEVDCTVWDWELCLQKIWGTKQEEVWRRFWEGMCWILQQVRRCVLVFATGKWVCVLHMWGWLGKILFLFRLCYTSNTSIVFRLQNWWFQNSWLCLFTKKFVYLFSHKVILVII